MSPLTALCVVLVVACACAMGSSVEPTDSPIDVSQIHKLWTQHITAFGLTFVSKAAEQRRFEIFKENVDFINEENSKELSPRLGLGPHTHLTYEEFLAGYTGLNPDSVLNSEGKVGEEEFDMSRFAGLELPPSFDWRDHPGVIGPVRDQEKPNTGCGSCYAHASLGVLESTWALKHRELPSLAPQQIVDCAPPPCHGCKYGDVRGAYKYLFKAGGSHTEASYPYKGVQGTCRTFTGSVGANLTQNSTSGLPYRLLPKDEMSLKAYLVNEGPFVATINANKLIQHWRKGIIMSKDCPGRFNHFIQIVGYTTVDSQPVWIIKNSWGTKWAMGGYGYLQAGVPNPCSLYHELVVPFAG